MFIENIQKSNTFSMYIILRYRASIKLLLVVIIILTIHVDSLAKHLISSLHWHRRLANLLPLTHTPTGDQTQNPHMCPDWELNAPPFCVSDEVPTNWAALARATIIVLLNPILINDTLCCFFRGQGLLCW